MKSNLYDLFIWLAVIISESETKKEKHMDDFER